MANPHFYAPEGEFEIDYRSYDGLVGLGSKDWTFWTKWSTAAHGSIHTYSDAGTIVAVAPDTYEISGVTPQVFEAADFSSRSRTPHTGEVVLLQNAAGFAAAVLVLDAIVARESRPGAALRARYRILTDGGRDFSQPGEPTVQSLTAAIGAALTAYDALKDVPDPPMADGWIGHNGPPDDAKLSKEDLARVADELRRTLERPTDEAQLKALREAAGEASTYIAAAIAKRYAWIQEGFYRQVGAMGAVVLAALGVWVAFHGTMLGVDEALAAVGNKLFGWPS